MDLQFGYPRILSSGSRMKYISNIVEIPYEEIVITNPENRLIINDRLIQQGIQYRMIEAELPTVISTEIHMIAIKHNVFKTIWNWIRYAARSLFKR